MQHQVVYHEEFTQARLPRHPDPSVGIVGPTLILHGTPAQRSKYISKMLRADEMWCQGFSEPDAGSDLPGLKTRAVRDGDCYVVSGQKIWTSFAHRSDWMYALVRTGPPELRQASITFLIIDMRSPGISIKPIRDMAENRQFCEVFFDEVRVPVDNRVAAENEGWPIARTSLGHERSAAFIAMGFRYRRILSDLMDRARASGAADELGVRQTLADLEIRSRLLLANGYRTLAEIERTGEPGPGSAVARLFNSTFEKDLHEAAVNLLGSYGLLHASDAHVPDSGKWNWGFLRTRASSIGAGTSEIQRNTIAEQVLGLPRDS